MVFRSPQYALTKIAQKTEQAVNASRDGIFSVTENKTQRKGRPQGRIFAGVPSIVLLLLLFISSALLHSHVAATTSTTADTKASSISQQIRQFNIPRQRADGALTAFGQQADLTVVYQYDRIKNYHTNQLQGDYKVTHAVAILLANTGLSAEFDAARYLIITDQSKGKKMNTANSSKRKTVLAGLVGLFAAGGMTQAVAQGGEAATGQSAIDEIIVTANKREQSLQDTAMSISVLSGDEIDRKGLVSMHDYLNSIPSVTFIDSGPGQNQIIIRGIGLSQFEQATVSSYFGEVPLTPSIGGGGFAQLGGSSTDMKMVDLKRVEVLKGPQGTLYGSGSMGGTVRNIPNAPELNQLEGYVDMGYGITSNSNEGNNKLVGVLNLPLVDDSLALRLVGYRFDNSGYIDRVSEPKVEALAAVTGLSIDLSEGLGGHTYTGGRASLLWQPSERMKLNLMLASQTLEEDGNGSIEIGLGGYRSAVLSASGTPEFNEDEFDIANITFEYEFEWASLLGTYSHFEGDAKSQFIAADAFLAGTIRSYSSKKKGDTLELRLTSNIEGPLQYVTGVYYEDFALTGNQIGEWSGDPVNSPVPPLPGTSGPNGYPITYLFPIELQQSLEHKAIFGEISYSLNEQLDLTVGARWFDYDRRDNNLGSEFFGFFGQSDLSTTERDSTYKLNISYTPNDDALFYAQWAEGFRLGSGQVLPPASVCDTDNDGKLDFTNASLDPSVQSDYTSNYELGGKFTLLDERLTLNMTLYRIDWDEIPVNIFDTSVLCPGNLPVIENAGEAKSEGFELETRYLATQNLQLSLSASYMETEILTDGLGTRGDRLPLAPRFNGIVGMQYNFEWAEHSAFLRTDYSYIGDFISDGSFTVPDAESYGKWNLRAGIEVNQWSFEIYGNNLTNEDALAIGQDVTVGRRVAPRVIGFDVGYTF